MSVTVARRVARRNALSSAAKPHHDLQAIFNRLNARYFEGKLQATITWMRYRSCEWERKRMNLGVCHIEKLRIRIHPALGQKWVPRYVVEATVFHEILHLIHNVQTDAQGRRHLHTPEFRAHERQFPLHRLAQWWESQHTDRLHSF